MGGGGGGGGGGGDARGPGKGPGGGRGGQGRPGAAIRASPKKKNVRHVGKCEPGSRFAPGKLIAHRVSCQHGELGNDGTPLGSP